MIQHLVKTCHFDTGHKYSEWNDLWVEEKAEMRIDSLGCTLIREGKKKIISPQTAMISHNKQTNKNARTHAHARALTHTQNNQTSISSSAYFTYTNDFMLYQLS